MMKRVFGKKPVLKVGIFGKAGEEKHEDSDLTVLAIATFHEFGLGVPERSFIRAWCDAHEKEVEERLAHDSERAAKGEIPWEMVMERLGLFIQGGIQQLIADGIDPPLVASTIKRKGSSVPLINTGQLRSSISYQVADRESE
jgi:hypothetical protein